MKLEIRNLQSQIVQHFNKENNGLKSKAKIAKLPESTKGKRLYPTESVKYLGVKIDTNLSWQYHVNDLSIKLNRGNALLFKMRKYVSLKILRSIYFAIFDSCLSYCCLVWAQHYSTIQRIIILQKMAIRIINLQPINFHASPLFK